MSEQRLNKRATEMFRECAKILQHQTANPTRVNAYLRAANVLDALQDDVRRILDSEGTEGLVKLPGIGTGLAAAIRAGWRPCSGEDGHVVAGADRPHPCACCSRSMPGIASRLLLPGSC